MEITQELLKELFDYKDGFLYRRVAPKYKPKNIGTRPGCLTKYKHGDRYRIKINYKLYFQNRLIFLWHHGYLPEIVDHRDRDTTNDRIENLRASDAVKNQYNKVGAKNSTSRFKGVCWDNREQKWHVQINTTGKPRHLAYCDDEEKAALIYNKEAKRCNGEHALLNVI